MGCIVNGPGEMADADFPYVGGAPGKVNLYVGKTAVKFNIPESKAVDRLKDLIREHGKWVDPLPEATPLEAVSSRVYVALALLLSDLGNCNHVVQVCAAN
jgi:GcpE protein